MKDEWTMRDGLTGEKVGIPRHIRERAEVAGFGKPDFYVGPTVKPNKGFEPGLIERGFYRIFDGIDWILGRNIKIDLDLTKGREDPLNRLH